MEQAPTINILGPCFSCHDLKRRLISAEERNKSMVIVVVIIIIVIIKNNNNNNNNNNKIIIIALKGAIRDFYNLLIAPRTVSNT